MVLRRPGPAESEPLEETELPVPAPGPGEIAVAVERCGVCRTDLHVVEGDLPMPRPSIVPGHEVVGRVTEVGAGVTGPARGDRIGIPWLRSTCGRCGFCLDGRENLCASKRFTGYTEDGGYAEAAVVPADYALPLPPGDPAALAPLLCAGIIGYRALKLVRPRPGGRIGLFGFGASAHLALQVADRTGSEVVAFSRRSSALELARSLGASETVLVEDGTPPALSRPLDGAIVFAPNGEVVRTALGTLGKGGRLAIAGLHLSPIPSLDYDRLLFGERSIQSVEANTRADAREFLDLATRLRLTATAHVRPLREANAALRDLKAGRALGALVLDCAAR